MLLVTIPFSHYNERARWALQHHGFSAHERRYLPMFHMYGVWRVTSASDRRSDRASSGYSTPVLVCPDRTVLADSGEIVRWADAQASTPETTLYPEPHRQQIEAFEAELHDTLGPDTRLLVYWFMLRNDAMFGALVRGNVAWWQRVGFWCLRPLAKAGLRRRMDLSESSYRAARQRVSNYVAQLGERLDGGRYLFGDRFTAADLTAATMFSPLLMPLPGYGAAIPTLSDELAELSQQMRTTPLGAHALRMYADHRPSDPTWTRS